MLDGTTVPACLTNGGAQANKALVARWTSDGVTGVSAHADHGVVGRSACCRATAGPSCGPVQGVRVSHHSIGCKQWQIQSATKEIIAAALH